MPYRSTPRPLASLTRPELSARVETLRAAIDLLASLAEAQGAVPFGAADFMETDLMLLERRLRTADRIAAGQSPEQIADVVVRHLHRAAERASA